MLLFAIVLSLLTLLAPSGAKPRSQGKVLEQLRGIPDGWVQGAKPADSTLLTFRIAVRQKRQAEFEQLVIDMSTPDHPSYGRHLKRDQMKSFLRPSARVSEVILDWLHSGGVSKTDIQNDGDWIKFSTTVASAEKMLHTQFFYFHHAGTGFARIRTLQYSVPSALHPYVQMIQPTTRFGQLRAQTSLIVDYTEAESHYQPDHYNAKFCNTTITPQCLRGLYQLDNFVAQPDVGNSLGVSGYLEQYAQYAELERFVDELAPYAKNATFNVASINDGLNTQGDSGLLETSEANLDIQYGVAMSYNTPITYYTTPGRGPLVPDLDQPSLTDNQNEPYLDQLHYLLSLDDDQVPKVLTTSYGEDEQSLPVEYARAVCSLFAQLGSRGTSVVFSSGDTGVGSACQTNDGKNTTRFLPIFPGSCPFVTAVGGTSHVEPEIAVSFSSGGFSDLFPRPAYQSEAVNAYLDRLGAQWDGLYNRQGRGFPDVAAQAVNFSVYDHGVLEKISGTSCSAPTFAGIIASLNSILLSSGNNALGFLNPWIYQKGYRGLTDIVDGGSAGCTGVDYYSGLPTPIVPNATWAAVPGWDPVTGYGTPLFPKLVELIGLSECAATAAIEQYGTFLNVATVQKDSVTVPVTVTVTAISIVIDNMSLPSGCRPVVTHETQQYSINGSGLPDVNFDIGESYAGLLPISNDTNSSLYFWFFPSPNPAAQNEITIWLNGGPGCSSLEGFFQENGPVAWQYGTFAPVPNPYSWVNLTNMIWIEQPVGTGFSQGTPTATSQEDVATQFLGFWKNLVDTFALHGFTVYITGESYAGKYVPYIANGMFDADDKEYYNVSSIMIYDPSLNSDAIQEQIPAVPFVDYWASVLPFNESFKTDIHQRADSCNYTSYLNDYLVYPPKGPLPTPPNVDNDVEGCDLWSDIYYAATEINPCFDVYQVATTCPLLWDVMGFPGSFDYVPVGAQIYFNRSDVQAAINAPIQDWAECSVIDVFVDGNDQSPPSGLSVLPSVIDRAERTIIGHGLLDYVLIYEGTLLAIQNMTFGGSQGFSSPPEKDFLVPNLEPELSLSSLAASGVLGKWHTERKLTLVSMTLAGHMVPQYAPSAAYRQMEFLLGRIPSLGETGKFTTQMDMGGAYGPFDASEASTTCDNEIVC